MINLNANGQKICFNELCENDKHEFIWTGQLLMASNEAVEQVWEKFINTDLMKKFIELKMLYDKRKKQIVELISKLTHQDVKKQNLCNRKNNRNSSSAVHSSIPKIQGKVLCIDLEPIRYLFTTENSRSASYILKSFSKMFDFQMFVYSIDREEEQNEIIAEFEYEFPIAGQMIITASDNFEIQKTPSGIKNRWFIKISRFIQHWATYFNIGNNNFYNIRLDNKEQVILLHEGKPSAGKCIFDLLRIFFEKNYLSKYQDVLRSFNGTTAPLIRCTHDNVNLGFNQNIVSNYCDIQVFHESSNPENLVIGKAQPDKVDHDLNNLFDKFKELLGLRMYAILGVNVPCSCLYYQLVNQNNNESGPNTSRLNLMAHYFPDFKPLGQHFWIDYKSNNIKYFYHPPGTNNYPLIGFGAALVVMHILNDCSWLDNDFKNVGYIVKNDHFEFMKLDADATILFCDNQQIKIKDTQNRNKTLIISNGKNHIYFEDLCEYDKFEFVWMASRLKDLEDVENEVWKIFMETEHSDKFKLLNEQWMTRKNKFLQEFGDIIKIRLDVDNYDPVIFQIKKNEEIFYTTDEIFKVNENKFIDKGGFGGVYEGHLIDDPEVKIAVKRIMDRSELLKTRCIIQAGNTSTIRMTKSEYNREIEAFRILETIKSPHLPQYYGAQLLPNSSGNYRLELGMELCDGNLENYINKHNKDRRENKKLSIWDCFEIFWQIVEGLDVLHANNITHRDLKPKNILFKNVLYQNYSNNESIRIWKIGDFGLATMKEKVTHFAGTDAYMAPEITNREEYGKPVDIWSLGLVLHFILFGTDYYNAQNPKNDYKLEQEECNQLNLNAIELLYGMITKDPQKRFKIEKVKDYRKALHFDNELLGKINKYDDENQSGKVVESTNIHNDKEAESMIKNAKEWMTKKLFQKACNMLLQVESYCSKQRKNNICISDVCNDIAICYKNKYQYEEASKYCEKNLLIKHGENAAEIVQGYESLGDWLRSLKKYELSFKYYEKWFSTAVKQCEENSVQVANVYEKMGDKLDSLDKYEEALKYYEKWLSINVQQYGKNTIQIADVYEKMGDKLNSLDKYEEAFEYYEKNLLIKHGENAVEIAQGYEKMGDKLKSFKKYKKALDFYEKWLLINLKQYEENSIQIADVYEKIGDKLNLLQEYEAALKYYEKWLSINVQQYGENSIQAADAYQKMGDKLNLLQEYEVALKYYEKWLSINVQKYGENSFQAADAYQKMGDQLKLLYKFEEALRYYENWLSIYIKKYGENSIQVVDIYWWMGKQLKWTYKYKELIEYYKKSFSINGKLDGEIAIQSTQTDDMIQNKLLSIYNDEEAFKYYTNKLLIKFAKNTIETAHAYQKNGNQLKLLDKCETLSYYEKWLSTKKKKYEEYTTQAAEASENLENHFKLLDKNEQAFKYYEKWSIIVRQYKEKNVQVGDVYQKMENQHKSLEKYEVAPKNNEKWLLINVKQCEENSIQATGDYQKIEDQLKSHDKYEEAFRYYEKSMPITLKNYGEKSLQAADMYEKMGNLLILLSKPEDAAKYHEKSFLIKFKHNEIDGVSDAEIFKNIGNKFRLLYKFDEALHYYEKALQVNVGKQGNDSLDAADLYENFVTQYWNLMNNEIKLDYLNRALQIKINQCKGNIFETNKLCKNFIDTNACLFNNENKLKYYEQILKFKIMQCNGDTIKEIVLYENFIKNYSEIMVIDKKLQYYEKMIAIKNNKHENNDFELANSYEWLAQQLGLIGQNESALKYREIAQYLKSINNNQSFIDLSFIYEQIGQQFMSLYHYDCALNYYQKSLSNSIESHGENHIQTIQLHEKIGDMLVKLNKHHEAVQSFNKAKLGMIKKYGPNTIEVAQICNKVGNLLNECEENKNALVIFEEVEPVFAREYGQSDPQIIMMQKNNAGLKNCKKESE